MEMTVSDESVIVEAHSMLHEIQWAEDHEDTWPNNPLEVVAMLQKVTRYAAFLESRLYADAPAAPTPPPADTGAGAAETVGRMKGETIADTLKLARLSLTSAENARRNGWEDDAAENIEFSIRHILCILSDITNGAQS
jgi:hypothetical protein